MITVEAKSRMESTKDARTERDDDVNVTIIFAINRNMLAMKFMKIARVTMLDVAESEVGRAAVSSS